MADEEDETQGESSEVEKLDEENAAEPIEEIAAEPIEEPEEFGDTDIEEQELGKIDVLETVTEIYDDDDEEEELDKQEGDLVENKEEKEKFDTGSDSEEEEQLSPLGPVISSLIVGSDEEEEEEEDEETVRRLVDEVYLRAEPIDREAILEDYKQLLIQQFGIKRKNSFLQYKLCTYYKRRKMDHVFKDEESLDEWQAKYEKRLDEFCTFREKIQREQQSEIADISFMKEQSTEQDKRREDEFRAMQKCEKDTAKGLIDTRTGKVISDKVIERLICRQNMKARDIAEIRLNYIKKKEKVKDFEYQLRALETIDGKLHLIDYEQLRIENQNFTDKIEERDDELRRLRVRYNGAVQSLAHVREKSSIIEMKIDDLANETITVEDELTMRRELVNSLKIERNKNRMETMKLKQDSGLLTYCTLLKDMERSWAELERTNEEVRILKTNNALNRRKLEAIRRSIEYFEKEPFISHRVDSTVPLSLNFSKVYKGRPSLLQPKLPKLRTSKFIK